MADFNQVFNDHATSGSTAAMQQIADWLEKLERGDNLGEAISEVVSVPGEEPHAIGVPPRQDAKAVVLYLVNPAGTRRRLLRGAREAGLKRARGPIGWQSAPQFTRY
jgi:hypothetical protein